MQTQYSELEQMSDEALCTALQNGTSAAGDILAHRYRKLVRCCAHPYFLAGGDSEDLLQEGMFGLIKAMREFRADREASFQTFAEVCIRSRLCSVIRASRAGKHSP